ncbi:cadmium-exporting ATPase [Proteobacteria bacterium CAG:495]|nr:cadmium-exporting ATPase [Proteobacteria bacterium CAG:495]
MAKQKKLLVKIIAALLLFVAAIFCDDLKIVQAALFLLSYFLVGWPILQKAVKNLFYGQVFDENFLMAIATVGAFALGEYSEGVAVMLFYQIGEFFQNYAVNKSRKSISGLMDIRPDYANLTKGKKVERVAPEEVKPGDVIMVTSGEKIPLDGEVVRGNSLVDTSAITGEAVPREVSVGDDVVSGCVNLSGVLYIKVSREFGQSTVAKILDLVENASSKKAPVEKFITKFARYYTPAVVISAVLIAAVPPLLGSSIGFGGWIYRALTFLVISCPCALVISVPLSFFGGIGAASRNGILVKGSNYLQALAEAGIAVFDKTGTLTRGVFEVAEICAQECSDDELLFWAASAGSFSNHPVSVSIRRAWSRRLEADKVSDFEELSGRGVRAKVEGITVAVGNKRLMAEEKTAVPEVSGGGTVVFVARGGRCAGWIRIADELKADSAAAIAELKQLGIKKTVMLSGDRKASAEETAEKIGIDEVFAELLPAQKVEAVECLLAQKPGNEKLIYTGDGINDAPVLARADIGIAMGGVGSDAAVEAADIVIMTDEPSKIPQAVKISKQTQKIVKQNIVFALGIKFGVLALGVVGMATMWEAVFADVGVSVLAILNSLRTLRIK